MEWVHIAINSRFWPAQLVPHQEFPSIIAMSPFLLYVPLSASKKEKRHRLSPEKRIDTKCRSAPSAHKRTRFIDHHGAVEEVGGVHQVFSTLVGGIAPLGQ